METTEGLRPGGGARALPVGRHSSAQPAGRHSSARQGRHRRRDTSQFSWQNVGAFVFIAVTATLLAWARLPFASRAVVWAEDGSLFLMQRVTVGVWGSFSEPYAGYLHFWPRMLTALASAWPDLAAYADLISLGSCILVGLVAALVFVCSSSVTNWLPARIMFAAITVLVPAAPIEVLGNAANVHWFLMWGAIWILLYTPKTWRGAIALSLLLFTFALSEIQMVLLVPLLLYRLRSQKMWVVRAGLLAALAIQVFVTLVSPRIQNWGNPPIGSYVEGYFIQVGAGNFFANQSTLGSVIASAGWGIGVLLFIPFALAFAYAMWRGNGIIRVTAAALLYVSVAAWVIAFRQVESNYWYSQFTTDQMLHLASVRYAIVPSLCVLALVPLASVAFLGRRAALAAAEPALAPRWRDRFGSVLAVIVPVALVFVMLAGFTPATTARVNQPDWPSAVAAAQAACATGSADDEKQIVTAPGGLVPPWGPILPCSFIDHH